MLKFFPYILKTLWRQRTRTLLTVSGAAVALFVFTFVGSVQEGLAALVHGGGADRSLIVFQASRFCPATSRLPEDYARTIGKMPGVEAVYPVKVFMNNCRASLDMIVFQGLPAYQLQQARNIPVTPNEWSDFEARQDGALVGRALAQRRGLAVGKQFTIGEITVTVSGIYATGNPAEECFVYTRLDFLQRGKGLNSLGTVTQFEVKLNEKANPREVCRAIDARFRGGPVATDTRPRGIFQARAIGDLAELIGVAHYLGYACVAMVLALVATTTVMAVQDRIKEHAVLQTLGFTWLRIFGLVLTESVILSVAGGLLGIGLALGILTCSGLAIGAEGVTIAFLPSFGLAVTGLVVTTLVGIAAGLIPAWQAARAEIVASLRYV